MAEDRMALVLKAQAMTAFEVVDLMILAEDLRRWQFTACQLAQAGEFDKLADHLMIPTPTVSVGQYVRLSDDGDFHKVEAIANDSHLTLDDGTTCNVENVYEVRDEI